MKSHQVDILNCGLIILSFVLAISLPIHLFLFSYIILGPLHYLTEIGWLNKRNYFAKERKDIWLLVAMCIIVSLAYYLQSSGFGSAEDALAWQKVIHDFNSVAGGGLVFLAFIAAMSFGLIKNKKLRYTIVAIAGIIALFIHKIDAALLLFGIFVPTIIHVSLFTAFFMFYGSLKAKSSWGYFSVFLFMTGCIAVFYFHKAPTYVNTSQNTFQVLLDSSFIHLGAHLTEFLGLRETGSDYMLLTQLGIQIQTLFAFCYTYHYLNWFSKTKVINWHEVSRPWLIATGVIWLGALTLYAIDYKTGFLALFFLSLLHVFLEFPLNHISMVGIVNELRNKT